MHQLHLFHRPYYGDRDWQFSCSSPPLLQPFLPLPSRRWESRFTGPLYTFNFTCPPNYFVSGLNTLFDLDYLDHQWQMECSVIAADLFLLSRCVWTEPLSPYSNFSFTLANDTVLAGVWSHYIYGAQYVDYIIIMYTAWFGHVMAEQYNIIIYICLVRVWRNLTGV